MSSEGQSIAGQAIRNELKKQKMSQRQLAQKAGVSYPMLNAVLKGKLNPSANYLYKLAQAFGKRLKIEFSDE